MLVNPPASMRPLNVSIVSSLLPVFAIAAFIKCPHLARPESGGKVPSSDCRLSCQRKSLGTTKETLHRTPLQLLDPATRHEILVGLLVEESPLLIGRGAHQSSDMNQVKVVLVHPWLVELALSLCIGNIRGKAIPSRRHLRQACS